MPRVLAVMGSGETAPAMAKVHRALFDRFGTGTVPAAILDTPYGFQENADELSSRTMAFFEGSVGNPVEVASFRSRDVDPVAAATALARIREARYVMAGPGSPSYALRHWADGPIPGALAAKLASGGIVTLASAAALTLGIVTIPVYEIYKVGEPPRWLDGLDLLGGATGLRAAVVPHYDNAEGGNHDTRFCYMGERRLRVLEELLPDGAFVLGVDSHTALLLDLEAGVASIAGLGGVTVRVAARSTRFTAGETVAIEALGRAARELGSGRATDAVHDAAMASGGPGPGGSRGPGESDGSDVVARGAAPIRDQMADLEGRFVAALDADDPAAAVGALLELDSAIEGRIRSGEDSPDLDNASATFRSLIVRLGERAATGGGLSREGLAPLVDALLRVRDRARESHDWATADLIRDRLADAGIEVRDTAEGPAWTLGRAGDPARGSAPG